MDLTDKQLVEELTKENAWLKTKLRSEEGMRDANKAAVVATVGGTVEGKPTHEGNYLQRLRELVACERRGLC